MKKNSSLKIPGGYMFRKKITPWCILALPMAFTIWLKYYPIFSAFFISLFRYDPINPPGQFAGLHWRYTGRRYTGRRGVPVSITCCKRRRRTPAVSVLESAITAAGYRI